MSSIICYINYSFFSSLFNVGPYSHVYTQQVAASREKHFEVIIAGNFKGRDHSNVVYMAKEAGFTVL